MCKFSIIIPNYNKGKYINECLDSIINQNFDKRKYEIIVVDDGSNDESLDIISKYPVKLLKTSRKGAGGARNKALNIAIGEYIIFIDSDDYLYDENVISELNKIINNQDIIFLTMVKNDFGKETVMVEEKNSLNEKIEKTKLLGCTTKCFKRKLIKDIRFTENIAYEDICFTLECLCRCQSYDYLETPFYMYRKVKNSNTTQEVSGKVMTDLILEISRIYYLCFKYPNYKDNLIKRIKNDNLPLRLEILNNLIDNINNNFRKYF